MLVGLGGGARDLWYGVTWIRQRPMLIVHLLYDVRDAMSANAVNSTRARAPGSRTGGFVGR